MDDFIQRILELVEKLLTSAILLATVAIFIGLPVWLAYLLVAPFFGADPLGHFTAILGYLVALIAFAVVATAVLMLGVRTFERSRVVRLVFRGVGYTFVALVVLSSLSQCFSGEQRECVPSRYIDC